MNDSYDMMRKKQTGEIQYIYCPTCRNKLIFKKVEDQQILGCPNCSFLFWNNPLPVVSALIFHNAKILLIKRKGDVYKDYWALPGGIINYLEEPRDALRREVYEETGMILDTYTLVDAYLIVYAPQGLDTSPSHTSIDLIYQCQITNKARILKKIKSNSEISDLAFFPLKKLPKLLAFKHRDIIIKHLSKV